MLRYYLPTIRKLVILLKKLQEDPFKQPQICLQLQEKLITAISVLETRIRKCKSRIVLLKRRLSTKEQRNTKAESAKIKDQIERTGAIIAEYKYIYSLYKSIGDGIAFLYINRFDLKPQNFKESIGYITKKKGTRLERRLMRYSLKNGTICILNDLTNVLKYFDLTVVKEYNVWIPIEVKSGNSKNAVQAHKGSVLMEYLLNDKPTDIYRRGKVQHRMSTPTDPIDNIKAINITIRNIRKTGLSIIEVEPGLSLVIGLLSEFESNPTSKYI